MKRFAVNKEFPVLSDALSAAILNDSFSFFFSLLSSSSPFYVILKSDDKEIIKWNKF